MTLLRLSLPASPTAPSPPAFAHGFRLSLHRLPTHPHRLALRLSRPPSAAVPLRLLLRLSPLPAAARPVQNVRAGVSAHPRAHAPVDALDFPADRLHATVTLPPPPHIAPPTVAAARVLHLHVDRAPLAAPAPCAKTPHLPPHPSGSPLSVRAGAAFLSDAAARPSPLAPQPTRIPYNLSSLLPADLYARYDPAFSDLLLVAGPAHHRVRLRLHRCVLALASPVFRAMLSADMHERRAAIIDLAYLPPRPVALAVEHMYGRHVQPRLTGDVAAHVYHFAHQFDIPSLLVLAREQLLAAVGPHNCLPALHFAVLYRDDALFNAALGVAADAFSELAASSDITHLLCNLPMRAMYALLESDAVRAIETNILHVALRWAAATRDTARTEEVLHRVRWGLMTRDMLDVVVHSGIVALSPRVGDIIRECHRRRQQGDHCNRGLSAVSQARVFGRPDATLRVPLLRAPPRVYAPPHAEKKVRRRTAAPAEEEATVEMTCERHGLRWHVRARARRCERPRCACAIVVTSVWIEEGEDGRVWKDDSGAMALPARVVVRCSVWDAGGGAVTSERYAATFKAAGWACGWSMEHRVEVRGEIAAVAVEICECEAVR